MLSDIADASEAVYLLLLLLLLLLLPKVPCLNAGVSVSVNDHRPGVPSTDVIAAAAKLPQTARHGQASQTLRWLATTWWGGSDLQEDP